MQTSGKYFIGKEEMKNIDNYKKRTCSLKWHDADTKEGEGRPVLVLVLVLLGDNDQVAQYEQDSLVSVLAAPIPVVDVQQFVDHHFINETSVWSHQVL